MLTKEEATERLLELCPPGTVVYTTLEHTSKSGMTRWIIPRVMVDNEPVYIGGYVEAVTGMKRTRRHDGNEIGGCGMDMGFALVHDLSYRLYPKGYGCIGEGCPSADHNNGDRDYTPHRHAQHVEGKAGVVFVQMGYHHWHKDGYALKQRWL